MKSLYVVSSNNGVHAWFPKFKTMFSAPRGFHLQRQKIKKLSIDEER
jgi:hypothetical protein